MEDEIPGEGHGGGGGGANSDSKITNSSKALSKPPLTDGGANSDEFFSRDNLHGLQGIKNLLEEICEGLTDDAREVKGEVKSKEMAPPENAQREAIEFFSRDNLQGIEVAPSAKKYYAVLVKILAGLPENVQQDVVDEFAGAVEAAARGERPKIGSVGRWLKKVAEAAARPDFMLERGLAVRQRREADARHDAARHAAALAAPPQVLRQPKKVDKAAGRQKMKVIKEILMR